MLNANVLNTVISAIKRANTIAIISHVNIDGDTMGSGLALYEALRSLGKEAYVFCDDTIPNKLHYLKGWENYNATTLPKYDLAIAVDSSSLDRIGRAYGEFSKSVVKMNIDHHITNEKYADINMVFDCAATCQMMYEIIDTLGLMNVDIASLLMCGLVTDSGIFSYSSVTPETLMVASKLLGYGVNLTDICEKVFKQLSMNAFRLKARTLNKAKFYNDNRIAVVSIMREDFEQTGTTQEHTEGIISTIREVEGVDVAIALAQVADKCFKISFRTSERVDASRIAMTFGGGGHIRASGCKINACYEEALERVLKAASDELC